MFFLTGAEREFFFSCALAHTNGVVNIARIHHAIGLSFFLFTRNDLVTNNVPVRPMPAVSQILMTCMFAARHQ